jgi:hypothetical protein
MPIIFVENAPREIVGRLMNYQDEIGHFSISKDSTPSVCFFNDEEEYTSLLLSSVCRVAKAHFNPTQRIYVDSDTSDGLWDKLGFIVNPLYDFTEDQRTMEGAGYEKYIQFSDLCKKCI